jgi:hypothetical protein
MFFKPIPHGLAGANILTHLTVSQEDFKKMSDLVCAMDIVFLHTCFQFFLCMLFHGHHVGGR